VAVNVQGTLNLLEEAVAEGSKVDRFVFTSTTSLMISQKIRDGRAGGAREAIWIDETLSPLEPRNWAGRGRAFSEKTMNDPVMRIARASVERFGTETSVPADQPGADSLARMLEHRSHRRYAERPVAPELDLERHDQIWHRDEAYHQC
jgi:UDP-glucose 4-epimerase